MTDRELRKLRRTDLLELLLTQEKENEELRRQLQEALSQLESRNITMAKAGSIAEASVQLNGVFEAAQAAADQYLENIRNMNQEKEAYCAHLEAEAQEKAGQLLRDAEERCSRMEQESRERADQRLQETEERCANMLEDAKRELRGCWVNVSARMEELYKLHSGQMEQEADSTKGNVSE